MLYKLHLFWLVFLANSYLFRMFMQSSFSPKQVHVCTIHSRICMHAVVQSVNGATVARSVRTWARGESMSGSVITRCITLSFTKCMAVVGYPTHLNDVKLIKWKKKTLGLLDNNGFLIFLDHISLIVTMNVYEAIGPNNSHSRITTSIKSFTK